MVCSSGRKSFRSLVVAARGTAVGVLALVSLAGSAQTGLVLAVTPSFADLVVGQGLGLRAFGDFPEGPRELSQSLSTSSGESHSCSALISGEVYCWGSNASGQLGTGDAVDSLRPMRVHALPAASAVAAGRFHSCALLQDQTVQCWGGNANGQLGDGTTSDALRPVTVQNVSDAIALSAGPANTCALLGTGAVQCWGADSNGELGDGMGSADYLGYSALAVYVSGITDATALAVGGLHACALRSGGRVNCWGGNFQGAIGDGSLNRAWTPVEVSNLADAVGVSAGLFHSCALREDQSVVCWGGNQTGALGDGSNSNSTSPVAVSGLSAVASLGSGWGAQHSCAVSTLGRLRCWGDNAKGQLGDGTQLARSTPVDVMGIGAVIESSLGRQHSCAELADGSIQCWGENSDGRLGDGSNLSRLQPVPVTELTVSWLSSDPAVALVGIGGGVIAAGAGSAQIQARSGESISSATIQVRSRLSTSVSPAVGGHVMSSDGKISCGSTCSATYESPQTVDLQAVPASGFEFGGWNGDCSGTGACTLDTRVDSSVGATFVSRTYSLSVATAGEGRVQSMPAGIDCGSLCTLTTAAGASVSLSAAPGPGSYFLGWTGACSGTGSCQVAMTGDRTVGATFATRSLVALDLVSAASSVSAGQPIHLSATGLFSDGTTKPISGSAIELGDGYSCALMRDGSMRCWGGAPAPQTISGSQGAVSLAAGTSHACSAMIDGSVRCWGRNVEGQLGNGTTAPAPGPVNVLGLSDAVAVVGGSQHSCALEADGGVSCWGAGGLLGDVAGQASASAVAVSGVGDVLTMSNEAGAPTCVLTNAGEVRCWNTEIDGDYYATPTARPGLGAVVGIAAAPLHSCALLANGQIECWGRTDFGILGDGGAANGITSGPVTVSGIGNAIALALGDVHSCALMADRTVKCWGNGSLGQLGNGGGDNSNVPVAVSGVTDVVALAAGDHHSCAVRRDGSLRCWGENNLQQLGVATPGQNIQTTPVTPTDVPTVAALEWSSSDPAVATVTAQGIVVPHMPGTTILTASLGNVSDSVSLTVLGNTPTGSAVEVTPVDAATAATPATLTFSNVVQSGQTSVVSNSTGPAVPTGFRVGDPALYYDLETTSIVTGSITVCLSYDGVTFDGSALPRLFHYENGAWVDRTTSTDALQQVVCGVVTSLSPFALFESSDDTPPSLKCSVDPRSLRPPNHRMVEVTATVKVSDAGSGPAGAVLRSVTSSEADSGLGSGDLAGDISGFVAGTSSFQGQLRAERYSANGRTYVLEYEGADRAGNTSRCQVSVKVPHNAGG